MDSRRPSPALLLSTFSLRECLWGRSRRRRRVSSLRSRGRRRRRPVAIATNKTPSSFIICFVLTLEVKQNRVGRKSSKGAYPEAPGSRAVSGRPYSLGGRPVLRLHRHLSSIGSRRSRRSRQSTKKPRSKIRMLALSEFGSLNS